MILRQNDVHQNMIDEFFGFLFIDFYYFKFSNSIYTIHIYVTGKKITDLLYVRSCQKNEGHVNFAFPFPFHLFYRYAVYAHLSCSMPSISILLFSILFFFLFYFLFLFSFLFFAM